MRKIKKLSTVLCLLIVFMFGIIVTGCGNNSKTTDADKDMQDNVKPTQSSTKKPNSNVNTDELLSGKHHVEIVVENFGIIKVELDADVAPITVTNFVKLANEGFYDGLTFHRIIDGFMVQGGDPLANGTGGADQKIVGEFSANGHENSITHVRGTISMARSSGGYDTASSQFFIVQADSTFLDGQYAGFGTVTSGMEIVDAMCRNIKISGSDGEVAKDDQPVITEINVID